MTLSPKQQELQNLIDHSRAFKLLIPIYQEKLRASINNNDFAVISTLLTILKREDSSNIQSVYFVEDILSSFAENNLGPIDNDTKLEQKRVKAKHLLQSFLFFSPQQKEEIFPYINQMDLKQVTSFINLYKLGHQKQNQYLQIFASKDPKSSIKFEVITKNLS